MRVTEIEVLGRMAVLQVISIIYNAWVCHTPSDERMPRTLSSDVIASLIVSALSVVSFITSIVSPIYHKESASLDTSVAHSLTRHCRCSTRNLIQSNSSRKVGKDTSQS